MEKKIHINIIPSRKKQFSDIDKIKTKNFSGCVVDVFIPIAPPLVYRYNQKLAKSVHSNTKEFSEITELFPTVTANIYSERKLSIQNLKKIKIEILKCTKVPLPKTGSDGGIIMPPHRRSINIDGIEYFIDFKTKENSDRACNNVYDIVKAISDKKSSIQDLEKIKIATSECTKVPLPKTGSDGGIIMPPHRRSINIDGIEYFIDFKTKENSDRACNNVYDIVKAVSDKKSSAQNLSEIKTEVFKKILKDREITNSNENI